MRPLFILAIVFLSIQNFAQQSKSVTMVVKKEAVTEIEKDSAIISPPFEIDEPVFVVVEEPATFNGGDLISFRFWVQNNIKYPEPPIPDMGERRVYVQFVVNSSGFIQNIMIVKSSGLQVLDNEVVRLLSTSPKWKPARQGGSAVMQKFTMPVVFSLN